MTNWEEEIKAEIEGMGVEETCIGEKWERERISMREIGDESGNNVE
jgi:hypothetical protein